MSMRYLVHCLPVLLIFLAFATPSRAQKAEDTYAAEIAEASQLGQLLYAFDRSAWVATDALRAKRSAWTLYTETATPIGWVTTEAKKRELLTSFVADLNGETVVVFDAWTRKKKVKRKTTYPMGRALTATEQAQITAKRAFDPKTIEPCAQFLPMNVVVIPNTTGGQYLYVMSATQQQGLAVLGRHYRFTISDDGRALTDRVAFTNSCIGLPTGLPPNAPKGAKPFGLFFNHVLTPYPQETHVFASLSHNLDIILSTPKAGKDVTWKISGAKIKPFDKDVLK